MFNIFFVFLLATYHMPGTWLLLDNCLLNGGIKLVTAGSRVSGQMVPKSQKPHFFLFLEVMAYFDNFPIRFQKSL